jgi:hypothetical protein
LFGDNHRNILLDDSGFLPGDLQETQVAFVQGAHSHDDSYELMLQPEAFGGFLHLGRIIDYLHVRLSLLR